MIHVGRRCWIKWGFLINHEGNVIYSALDEKELAFEWLEQAFEDHDMEMVWLKTEPKLYPLHDDPRFQDLLKRVEFDVSG